MKLDSKTYRVLWEAHAWAGALASVLLVGMFLLGVFSLFQHELTPWQEPRLRDALPASDEQVSAAVQRVLDEHHGAKRLDVDLPAAHAPWLRVATGEGPAQWLNPMTFAQGTQRSELGEFLFLMHFLYPLPGGMWLGGLVATVLLLVVGSGAVIQLGRFRRELVRFRAREALRTLWSDLHKVLGSVGLPFQAVIAWTAAIICLNATVLQPIVVHTAFDGSLDDGLASIGYPRGPSLQNAPGPTPDAARVISQARRSLPSAEHYKLSFRNLGDASAFADVRGHEGRGLAEFTTVRVAANGSVLYVRPAGGPGIASKTLEGAYVLHSGNFAGYGLRLVWALLGLFSALCVLTGNLMWLVRRAGSMRRIDVVLAKLTAGGCGGAAVALAAIFLSNQLLPESLQNRAEWEHACFYVAWCLSVAFALVHPRAAWSAQLLLIVAGLTLIALPLIDAWQNPRVLFDPSGSPYVFWTELGLVSVGAIFLFAVWVLRRLLEPAGRDVPTTPERALTAG